MESEGKRRLIRVSVWVAVLALLLGALSSLATALAASAHTALHSMTPAAESTVTALPAEVVLEFTEPVSASFAAVGVTGADGASAAAGRPTVAATAVSQRVAALPPGPVTVTYRVVSDDGHPVSGQARFVYAPAGATEPTSTAPPPDTTGASDRPASGTADSEDAGPNYWVMAGGLLLAVGGVLWAVLGRRPQDD